MLNTLDVWALLAGIALFLFAMTQLESALKSLGGRTLSGYLQRQAGKPVNAVLGGVVTTALLQSSSVVGLMVLAFTGAGLLALPSALGIVFGSNLGTTFTGWVVATLGFKLELARLAFPLIAIGGGGYLFAKNRTAEAGRVLLGLGLLLLALQFMKNSVAGLEQSIDIEALAGRSAWQYLLVGIVVAGVIQSSSATMMLTLTALSAGIIELENAVAIAIGGDLGTTTTIMLGALKGSASKKRVALGHLMFNLVATSIAFALRVPLLQVIALVGIDDPLYSLVAFHSLFNLIGLTIFVPLTRRVARWLSRAIASEDRRTARYLSEVGSDAGEAALTAVENEVSGLIGRAVRIASDSFDPPIVVRTGRLPVRRKRGVRADAAPGFEHLYHCSKRLEGEILRFAITLQASELDERALARLGQLMTATRRAMRSAKSVKDVRHNLLEFAISAGRIEREYLRRFRESTEAFLTEVFALREKGETIIAFDDLATLLVRQRQRHDDIHAAIFDDVRAGGIDEMRISTLLNVNRRLLNGQMWLLRALADYYLTPEQVEDLEQIPRD